MPIDYKIHPDRKLVIARGRGVFTTSDVFGYQREVWSREDVVGFNELVDMTGVTEMPTATPERIRELAALAASMDRVEGGTKMAIVAPQDSAFGLGRMFEAYRSFEPASKKEVAVFRTISEALAFLGLEGAVLETVD